MYEILFHGPSSPWALVHSPGNIMITVSIIREKKFRVELLLVILTENSRFY
jgi:hypothetical protein